MQGEKNDQLQMEDFMLGRPALVCRWRLASRALRSRTGTCARSVGAASAAPPSPRSS